MVAIKRSRKPLYRVLFVRYVTRRDDIMGADRLRMSVTTYQERMQRAFNWLHGFFERDRGP